MLVVDDERAIQRALKATLEAAGYHVDVVGTCADALAQVALKPPDLVLLDLLLPDGTGDEVAREIRTWSNVPILLVSAVGDEREKVKALDAGADDYVTKPFGIDELLARVRAMLRRAVDRPRPDAVVELGELRVDLARRLRDARTAPRSTSRRSSTTCCARSSRTPARCSRTRRSSRRCGGRATARATCCASTSRPCAARSSAIRASPS